ncbi:hypothetical protein, partial [Pseudomonas urethralis]|uniref:hypothetical protein n=1 Tax=Pseudomonas urethralis TaxID=2740517 RepID=UPI00353131BC
MREHDGSVQGAYLFAYDITDRLAEQRLLGRGHAPLLPNPDGDVVGKQGNTLHDAVMLSQGVETGPHLPVSVNRSPASASRHIGMIRSWSAGWLASTAGRC